MLSHSIARNLYEYHLLHFLDQVGGITIADKPRIDTLCHFLANLRCQDSQSGKTIGPPVTHSIARVTVFVSGHSSRTGVLA